MGLILTITNAESLDNGVSTRLELDRHGAIIGRSPTVDWSLPDDSRVISSTHCEIDYRGGAYLVIDKSVNGTFVNGAADRITAPHALADGDVLAIGHYEIGVRMTGAAAPRPAAASDPEGDIWVRHGGAAPDRSRADDWLKPEPRPVLQGGGPLSQIFTPPTVEPARRDPWDVDPAPPPSPPSAWSSDTAGAPPAADDIWGKFAATNAVDWTRGGFGAEAPPWETAAAKPDTPDAVLGLSEPALPSVQDSGRDIFGLRSPPPVAVEPAATPPAPVAPVPAPAPKPTPAPLPPAVQQAGIEALLAAAGLTPADARGPADQTLAAAGQLLRRMTAGLVVMLEARARAKQQLGAAGTIPGVNNNPLKFARTPEGALLQLLNAPERNFMAAGEAVEDAFKDLQAHQMATLAAMQGALAATLARFSPQSIRDRAETGGVLNAIVPNAKAAALWKAYEKEFEGVARGSDEAFMDVFAKEFRAAYERAAEEMRGRR